MVYALVLPFLLGLASAALVSPECAATAVEHKFKPTMQFTPKMPTQKAPTTTVYRAIYTKYLNVVDCNYVMVENVDNNPTQEGSFTEKTTVPVLTVYRVGCMPATIDVPRRDVQAYDILESAHAQTELPTTSGSMAVVTSPSNVHLKRDNFNMAASSALVDIAQRLASGIDPTNENITVREFTLLQQINTALFALNVVNSGFPLDDMCKYMSDPAVNDRLEDSLINPSQAANIICFAAENGLFFGMSNEELLRDLAALEYAIQVSAYATQTLQQLCEQLDYTAAGFLGIDVSDIQTFICNGTTGSSRTITPLSTQTGTSAGNRTSAFPSDTGHGTAPHPTATANNQTSTSASSTDPSAQPGTISIILGTNSESLSSATSAAGTVAPWFNTTAASTSATAMITASARQISPHATTTAPLGFYNPPRLRRNGRMFY